ncbi:MAG: hypothetical protein CBD58_01645 [bacterium TMED198]|nr:MAG: hypothetical protein CBD58_01645 [bacterium TMED198]
MRIEIKEKIFFSKLMMEKYKYFLPANRINGISIDSRDIREGDIFIGIEGKNFDGNEFSCEALERGASLIVTNLKKNKIKSSKLLEVESTNNFIYDFSKSWVNNFDCEFVGITGSNGKTSTKEILYKFLSTTYSTFKTPANYNSTIGVPMSLFSMTKNIQIALIEMGASNNNEIRHICSIVKPKYGIITNISEAHTLSFGDIDGVIKAKSELFHSLPKDGTAFVNYNDENVRAIKCESEEIKFGSNEKCEYVYRMNDKKNYSSFYINNEHISLPQNSFSMFANVFASYVVAKTFHVKSKYLHLEIKELKATPGRCQIINKKEYKIIDDTYNANLDSVLKGLEFLNNFNSKGNKIAVIGDMYELGNLSDQHHLRIGEFISKTKINFLCSIGDYRKKIIKNVKGEAKSRAFDSIDEIVEYLNSILGNGDVVYIKGSRGMKMERIIKMLK